jgi:hypothetical protein
MAKEYQGHHCWNCWNVALYIYNDYSLYRLALECKSLPMKGERQGPPTLALAVTRFLSYVAPGRTPDGGRYTRKAVMNALDGLE